MAKVKIIERPCKGKDCKVVLPYVPRMTRCLRCHLVHIAGRVHLEPDSD